MSREGYLHDRAATCVGKERFQTPQEAWKVARRHPDRGHYRCPHCGRFHVGAQPRKRRIREGV